MEFIRVDPEEIDWERLDRHPERMVSQTRPWVDFIVRSHGGTPVFAKLRQGSRVLGYFTGVIVRRFQVPILGSPFVGWSSSYMGFNLDEGVARKDALRALERFAFQDLKCLHLEIKDRFLVEQDGRELGFRVRWAPTYLSDLRPSEDELFSGMTSACRRCIRSAGKHGVVIEEAEPDGFAEEYYDQLLDVFAKQGMRPHYGLDRVQRLIECIWPSGGILLLRARDRDGRSIATSIYAGIGQTSVLWGNASYRQYQINRPNEALHWSALLTWKKRGMIWHDWGGGGVYKEKYGATRLSFPHFYKSKYEFIQIARTAAYHAYYLSRSLSGKAAMGIRQSFVQGSKTSSLAGDDP